jgi:four helix bundle protein
MAEHRRQDLKARTFAFSATLLAAFKALSAGGPQYDHMARQLFAAGTSIGAMVEEAEVALSRRDFAAKYVVALREARESNYWLRLFATQPSHVELVRPLVSESGELVAILTTSVKKLGASPDS